MTTNFFSLEEPLLSVGMWGWSNPGNTLGEWSHPAGGVWSLREPYPSPPLNQQPPPPNYYTMAFKQWFKVAVLASTDASTSQALYTRNLRVCNFSPEGRYNLLFSSVTSKIIPLGPYEVLAVTQFGKNVSWLSTHGPLKITRLAAALISRLASDIRTPDSHNRGKNSC